MKHCARAHSEMLCFQRYRLSSLLGQRNPKILTCASVFSNYRTFASQVHAFEDFLSNLSLMHYYQQQPQYVCSACGVSHPKWSGRCSSCLEWNSLGVAEQTSASLPSAAATTKLKKLRAQATATASKSGVSVQNINVGQASHIPPICPRPPKSTPFRPVLYELHSGLAGCRRHRPRASRRRHRSRAAGSTCAAIARASSGGRASVVWRALERNRPRVWRRSDTRLHHTAGRRSRSKHRDQQPLQHAHHMHHMQIHVQSNSPLVCSLASTHILASAIDYRDRICSEKDITSSRHNLCDESQKIEDEDANHLMEESK